MANHCALSHCDFKMKLVCCGYRGNQEGTVSPHSSQGFYQATKCLKRRQDPPLPKGINLDLRGTHLSKQDGSSDKSTCSQTQQQEFNPWEPHGGTEHTEKAVLETPYSGDMVNCAAAHVEVGGQLCGICSLFPPCVFQRLRSGQWVWRSTSLPTESSHLPSPHPQKRFTQLTDSYPCLEKFRFFWGFHKQS